MERNKDLSLLIIEILFNSDTRHELGIHAVTALQYDTNNASEDTKYRNI